LRAGRRWRIESLEAPTEAGYNRKARPRRVRNPITETNAAFNVGRRFPENSLFGCPHHKHLTLATVVGLPQAEQTLTFRIEGIFPELRRG
jgi:hypothetical protein